jgi:phosphoribosylanthranilate isomerase
VAVEVKLCGLTRAADAELAATLGAHYLGVIYAGGPRLVTDPQAAAIVRAAAGRPVLGVFGAQSADDILRIRDATGIAGAQLHGRYTAADAARLRTAGLLVWWVQRLAAAADLDALAALAQSIASADVVLVEPRVPGAPGGAGVALDLALAVAARGRVPGRFALAGGLTPETVGRAVALVRPHVVDVSSGIEVQPGIKDPDRMRRFVEAAVGQHAYS